MPDAESLAPSAVSATPFEVPECFTQASNLSGDVVIRATHPDKEEEVQFWCHSILIYHSCDYFKAILSGEWSETSQTVMAATEKASTPTKPAASKRKRGQSNGTRSASARGVVVKAVIDLTDQTADHVCDLLHFIYPHLELTLTLDNVTGLVILADKLCYETLKDHCQKFLEEQEDSDPFDMLKVCLDANMPAFGMQNIKEAVYSMDFLDPGAFVKASGALRRPLAEAILQRRLHIAESLYAVLLHLVSHRLTKKCVECCALSGPWSQGYIVKRMVQNFRIGAKEEDVLEYLEEALELPTATCDCLEQQVKKFARLKSDPLLKDWQHAVHLNQGLSWDKE